VITEGAAIGFGTKTLLLPSLAFSKNSLVEEIAVIHLGLYFDRDRSNSSTGFSLAWETLDKTLYKHLSKGVRSHHHDQHNNYNPVEGAVASGSKAAGGRGAASSSSCCNYSRYF